jgi:hypothetical protein
MNRLGGVASAAESSGDLPDGINTVDGFFAKLARRVLKRGVFLSVVDLLAAIKRRPRTAARALSLIFFPRSVSS